MKSRTIHLHPIGLIHTPHTDGVKSPIQPVFSEGIKGTIELYPEFQPGLKDLDGFSHIYLLYHFDRSTEIKLQVVPLSGFGNTRCFRHTCATPPQQDRHESGSSHGYSG